MTSSLGKSSPCFSDFPTFSAEPERRESFRLAEMSGQWNFQLRVQSWSDEIESDPVLIRKFFKIMVQPIPGPPM